MESASTTPAFGGKSRDFARFVAGRHRRPRAAGSAAECPDFSRLHGLCVAGLAHGRKRVFDVNVAPAVLPVIAALRRRGSDRGPAALARAPAACRAQRAHAAHGAHSARRRPRDLGRLSSGRAASLPATPALAIGVVGRAVAAAGRACRCATTCAAWRSLRALPCTRSRRRGSRLRSRPSRSRGPDRCSSCSPRSSPRGRSISTTSWTATTGWPRR